MKSEKMINEVMAGIFKLASREEVQRVLQHEGTQQALASVYDAAGELLAVVAADVFDLNCKNMDLAVDSKGRVYIAETVQLHIQVFVLEQQGI